MELPMAKRQKYDKSRVFDSGKNLAALVDWQSPKNIAIEYHESLGKSININYNELKKNAEIIEEIFTNLESEFIGIDSNVPGMCIPALLLGINSSKNAFVCLPPSSPESELLKIRLEIVYIISKIRPTTGVESLHKIYIHGISLFLSKLILPVKASRSSSKNHFAYAIMTSGTTGSPKIVRVTENSIIPNIKDLKVILDLSSDDKIAQLTPLIFDPSVIEIFMTLSSGGRLFIASSDLKNDPPNLLTSMQTSRVTVIQSTPSVLMHRWSLNDLESMIFKKTSALRILLLGGELFPNPDILFKLRHNNCRFFNIYGITEVSCWASITEIFLTSNPNDIGKLLTDTCFKIIDKNNEIVIEGEGELLIGSDTRICLLDDEKIDDFELLPIFRKTGDLVKIDKSGKIIFKSRKNRRIKRFGHRIDLQSLENHINQLKIVEKSVALFNSEKQSIQIFFTIDHKLNNENLKENYEKDVLNHIKKLSSAYHPNKINLIDSFPINANGKICFTSLGEMSGNPSSIEHLEPYELFKGIWHNHLPIENCGFLSAGGNSIIALQIANEFSEITKNEYPELIGRLLNNETIESCKDYILGGKLTVENLTNKVDETTVKQIHENSSKSMETLADSVEHGKSVILPKNVEFNVKNDWFWQKCRGKMIFNPKFQQTNEIPTEYSTSSSVISLSKDFHKIIASVEFNDVAGEFKTIISPVEENFNKLTLHKSCNLRKCIDASPTIVSYNSSIYITVGSHSGIICTVKLTEVEHNETNWRVYLPDRIEASVLIAPEFMGIVGCYDGFVYSIHLMSGEIRWKFKTDDTVKCTAVFSSDGERIFFGSYDHFVYCLSVKNGTEVWKTMPSNGSISATGITERATNSVFFGTLDGTCVSLNQETGEILWKNSLKYPIFSSPVISLKTSIIFCDVSGVMAAFRLENGEKLWQVNVKGNVFSHLVIHRNPATATEDLIVASKDKNLYQFTIESCYKCPHLKRKILLSSPIIATPWVERSFIVVVTINGELVIVNSENGNFIGQYKVAGEVYSSPVMEGQFIAVGCRDDNFYIFSCK